MVEDWELCTYEKHHKQKIIFFLTAMRNYRDTLLQAKYDVSYHELDKMIRKQRSWTALASFVK